MSDGTLPPKRVFGQEQVSSIQTYFEYVRRNGDKLEVKVAGPQHYHNEMVLDVFDESPLLEAFQPPSYVDRTTGEKKTYGDHEKVETIDNLGGHSLIAFYQAGMLIGFQKI